MNENSAEVETLKQISPAIISFYLRKAGWARQGSADPRTFRWIRWNAVTGEDVELVLPIDKTLGDYGLRVIDFLTTLSSFEGRTSVDILRDLSRDPQATAGEKQREEEATSSGAGDDPPEWHKGSSLYKIRKKLILSLKVGSLAVLTTVAFFLGKKWLEQEVLSSKILRDFNYLDGLALVLFIASCFIIMRISILRAVDLRIQKSEIEMRGRMLVVTGYVTGELSIDQNTFRMINRDGMERAVEASQQGYQYLKEIGGSAEIFGLNNLLYYSSFIGDASRRSFMLKNARKLMEAGQEHNSSMLILTACKVLLQFGNNEEELSAARDVLVSLAASSRNSEREKREALSYLAAFQK